METYNFTPDERLKQAQKKVKRIKGFYVHATVYALVNVFLIFANNVTGLPGLSDHDAYVTPFFWVIGLLIHGISVFGQDLLLGKDWEEKEIQKILNK